MLAVETKIEGWVIVIVDEVAVHPCASVTTTWYPPAVRLLMEVVVAPVDHEYVYGAVPPAALAFAPPLLPPLHKSLLVIVAVAESDAGWVMVMDAVLEQLLASFTVTVNVPAVILLIAEVVAPLDQV